MKTIQTHCSPAQWDWLNDPSSLTHRLRRHFPYITHHLQYDGWGITDENTEAWIRRMTWCHQDTPWIAATVLIPPRSITEDTQQLVRAGEQSIGEVLFKDPHLTRSEFTFRVLQKTPLCCERRSIFHYHKKPVLITEVFYPAFLETIDENGNV